MAHLKSFENSAPHEHVKSTPELVDQQRREAERVSENEIKKAEGQKGEGGQAGRQVVDPPDPMGVSSSSFLDFVLSRADGLGFVWVAFDRRGGQGNPRPQYDPVI
jgi:hypothetical protein